MVSATVLVFVVDKKVVCGMLVDILQNGFKIWTQTRSQSNQDSALLDVDSLRYALKVYRIAIVWSSYDQTGGKLAVRSC